MRTAIRYELDSIQFGEPDEPLFADELLFYGAGDCEDRTILFTILIKEILNLDVIMLHYTSSVTGHVSTAVCFSEKIEGDWLLAGKWGETEEKKKYYICDPTLMDGKLGVEPIQLHEEELPWVYEITPNGFELLWNSFNENRRSKLPFYKK